MREIGFEKIVEVCRRLCEGAAFELSADVLSALEDAAGKESDSGAVKILRELIENARLAKVEKIPLCQDTGLAVVFVEQGAEVLVVGCGGQTLFDAINIGVVQAYEEEFLRKSVVAEPLNERGNTGSNTPAIIHYSVVAGDKLKLSVMTKGGGCENKSQFKMFKPTANREQVIDWIVEVVRGAGADACPPFVVGVGIGGNFELSALLSKKALLRRLGERNGDEFYAKLEEDLLLAVNDLGIGPGGLGGDTTALDCLVEVAGCHIASLPVAVNIECHSHRHKSVVI